MVIGARLPFIAVLVFTTFIMFPRTCCQEKQIKKLSINNNGFGAYSFEYETADGAYRREDGGIVSSSHGDTFIVRGEYGYVDPQGKPHIIKYTADANGYHPHIDNDNLSEDVELRRIFPSEFPQDTIRRTGSLDPEHLGRYAELKSYFRHPKAKLNTHFEELICFDNGDKKPCKIDLNRYAPEENIFYMSPEKESHVDRRRVFCLMLLCFTEDELDRVVASF